MAAEILDGILMQRRIVTGMNDSRRMRISGMARQPEFKVFLLSCDTV
jgi:hypothetical protein